MQMFCDRCGQQLREDATFCTACGKALGPPPVPKVVGTPADGRVGRHIKIVAVLWLVYSLLRLMEMGWILLIGRTFLPSVVQDVVIGVGPFPGRLPLGRLISGGLLFVGFWVGAFAVAELVTAWGLFERRPWARTLALIVGIVALLRFPFGTALGIYTLWTFLPGPAAQEYDRLSTSRV
jgi:zinc-ribbon domain